MSYNQDLVYNSTSCHPLLLNMSINNPSLFREPLTPSSLMHALCPETYVAMGVASVTLFLYIGTALIGLIGLVWQRSKPHIQARSIYLISANMIANLTLVLLVSLRVIVSKKYYPCFLLSLTFMLYPPLLTLPSILRGCRLYFLYRLNLKKKKLYGSNLDESLDLTESNSRKSIIECSNSSLVSLDSNNLSHSTSGITIDQSPSVDTNSSSTNAIMMSNNNNLTNTCDNNEINKCNNNLDISSRDRLLMKLYEFIASYKFFITIYVIVILVHISLWAIFGGIEQGVYNSSGSWVFVESGFFEASHGCNITPKILILLGIQAGFYIVCVFVINVLCILSDRDTFNIKLEELVLTVLLAVIIIIYTILGSIPVITKLVDYFLPYVLIIVVYSWLETVIGVILPVYQSIRDSMKPKDGNQNSENSENHINNLFASLLKDKKSFEIVSDFARRSYCLEDVLAWKQIQNFKRSKKRKQAAQDFIKTFLLSGSPLEMNIPNGSKMLESLQEQIDSSKEELPSNLFDELEFQCLFNMIDLLQRLKMRNEFIAKKLQTK